MLSRSLSLLRSPKRLIVTSGVAAVAASLAFAVPQLVSPREAQKQAALTNQLAERGIPVAPANVLEARRIEYLSLLTTLKEIGETYASHSGRDNQMSLPQMRSKVEQTMSQVRDLSHAELTLMMETVPDLRPLLDATGRLADIARQDRANQIRDPFLGLEPNGGGTINSSGFPDAPYSSEVGSVRPTTLATLIASDVWETADGVREVASRGCDQVVVAIGAGGNTSAVCIVVDGIWIVAKFVFWAIEFEGSDIDSAEIAGTYLRSAHLHTDIEGLQASVDAHDANIDADLAAHDASIRAELAAHDANIDADVAAHDAIVRAELAAHDANIDADLVAHDVAVQAKLGLAQATLDNKIELRRVHLQGITIRNRSAYLIVATEAGAPVDVAFDAIQVFNEDSNSFVGLPSASVLTVDTGTYVLELNIPSTSPAKVFRIRVTHDDVVDHFGELVFHRNAGTL